MTKVLDEVLVAHVVESAVVMRRMAVRALHAGSLPTTAKRSALSTQLLSAYLQLGDVEDVLTELVSRSVTHISEGGAFQSSYLALHREQGVWTFTHHHEACTSLGARACSSIQTVGALLCTYLESDGDVSTVAASWNGLLANQSAEDSRLLVEFLCLAFAEALEAPWPAP